MINTKKCHKLPRIGCIRTNCWRKVAEKLVQGAKNAEKLFKIFRIGQKSFSTFLSFSAMVVIKWKPS